MKKAVNEGGEGDDVVEGLDGIFSMMIILLMRMKIMAIRCVVIEISYYTSSA